MGREVHYLSRVANPRRRSPPARPPRRPGPPRGWPGAGAVGSLATTRCLHPTRGHPAGLGANGAARRGVAVVMVLPLPGHPASGADSASWGLDTPAAGHHQHDHHGGQVRLGAGPEPGRLARWRLPGAFLGLRRSNGSRSILKKLMLPPPNSGGTAGGDLVSLVVGMFLSVLAVMWAILPFLLIRRLDRMIKLLDKLEQRAEWQRLAAWHKAQAQGYQVPPWPLP